MIYYMHQSELRMQSYEASNRATWICNLRDLVEFYLREKSTRDEVVRDDEIRDKGAVWIAGLVDLIESSGSRRSMPEKTTERWPAGARSSRSSPERKSRRPEELAGR